MVIHRVRFAGISTRNLFQILVNNFLDTTGQFFIAATKMHGPICEAHRALGCDSSSGGVLLIAVFLSDFWNGITLNCLRVREVAAWVLVLQDFHGPPATTSEQFIPCQE